MLMLKKWKFLFSEYSLEKKEEEKEVHLKQNCVLHTEKYATF